MSYPIVPEPEQKYPEDLIGVEEEVEETEPIEDEAPSVDELLAHTEKKTGLTSEFFSNYFAAMGKFYSA